MADLTDEERDFLGMARGSIFAAINEFLGQPETTARTEAEAGIDEALDVIGQRYPNRAQRLLVLSVLVEKVAVAREALLDDLLRGTIHWVRNVHSNDWCSMGLPAWEADQIAFVTGLSARTIKARHHAMVCITLVETMEANGEDASEVRAKLSKRDIEKIRVRVG